jgi:single-strand DNA-binding protein
MYARATFIGRATRDCQVAELPSGKVKADFGLAVNLYNDQTSFFDIQAYEKKAELCSKYVTKGKLLWLECDIRPRSYEDKNGNKKYVTDYVIRDIEFLSSESTAKQAEEQPRKKPTLTEMYDCDEMPPF